ncbi:MAG: tRNA (adenosine(37)-N6)-threonylcarbamoyltransferase complex dimerization subunit type 1 TsaB [Elusimicrobia bacterium]|nr:tRNA (adenosine(37)-N6)-threonylcarbamoyltransferase complex dimerization subunit type 1 TsaB [Elusimicrobiota bacterium]
MKKGFLLAVDTAGDSVDLAVDDGGRVRRLRRAVRHADDALWPALESLLKKAGLRLEGLRGIVCATGPGRFTAVRIGVTFADTLARARGVPVVGLTRFAAFAPRLKGGPDGLHGLVIPALREESYLQIWRKKGASITPAADPAWAAAGGLNTALDGALPQDASGATAADLIEPGRRLLALKRRPSLSPLYLKPANYSK